MNGEQGASVMAKESPVSNERYFESYQDLDVHRLMLEDEVRTKAYQNAIEAAKDLIKDKVVMDVGAGTGILSLFCAKAGAKKVYAVEASNLADILSKVAEDNGFKDVIEVINSRVEDVQKEIKADIIVSEWMGFYLLHESMLDSVIFARDKFLKPGGLMFPHRAEIFAAPCKATELWRTQCGFWKEKQYGFDMGAFWDVAKTREKLEICSMPSDGILSDPQLLFNLDLMKVSNEELRCLKDRRFFAIEEDGEMQGVCIWFVCQFPVTNSDGDELTLSTAPWDPETHWKQAAVLFPEATEFEAGDIMGWELVIEKASLEPGSRFYRIHLETLDANEEHPVPCLCGSVKCELVRHFINTHPENKSLKTEETALDQGDNGTMTS